MTYALQVLTPGLESQVETVTVHCDGKIKDFHTLSPDAHSNFATEILTEFPVGKKLAGIVLDVTVNYQNWAKTQYLYACLLGKESPLEFQHSTSFRVTMEMLLFTCVTAACKDTNLQNVCRQVFQAATCSCIVGWQLHKYDIDVDGCVVKKLEGAGGRIDYHIVAACEIGDEIVYHNVGHIYYTTNWKRNTYHAKSPLPPCTRALVVCGHQELAEPFRNAVATAWLALSANSGGPTCCLLPRCQSHPAESSCRLLASVSDLSPEDTSWVFPHVEVPPATVQTKCIVENIIRQCKLVCPSSSTRDAKIAMLQRLLCTWHPDKMTRQPHYGSPSVEVFLWLQKLGEFSSLHRV